LCIFWTNIIKFEYITSRYVVTTLHQTLSSSKAYVLVQLPAVAYLLFSICPGHTPVRSISSVF